MSPQEGDDDDDYDDLSDNLLQRSYKTSISTEDTSDEDFDAGRYSTPRGMKVGIYCFASLPHPYVLKSLPLLHL